MAKKRRQDRFVGRVFWFDPATCNDYQYESSKSSMERIGYFCTDGIIEMADKLTCVIIHDTELIDPEKVRSNTDIPWVNIIRVEEHLGKNKWKTVKI